MKTFLVVSIQVSSHHRRKWSDKIPFYESFSASTCHAFIQQTKSKKIKFIKWKISLAALASFLDIVFCLWYVTHELVVQLKYFVNYWGFGLINVFHLEINAYQLVENETDARNMIMLAETSVDLPHSKPIYYDKWQMEN